MMNLGKRDHGNAMNIEDVELLAPLLQGSFYPPCGFNHIFDWNSLLHFSDNSHERIQTLLMCPGAIGYWYGPVVDFFDMNWVPPHPLSGTS